MRATLAGRPLDRHLVLHGAELVPTSGTGSVTMLRNCHRTSTVRHPAAVIGRWQPASHGAFDMPDASTSRGPEHRIPSLTLAALLVIGGVMGMINLFVSGVLRDGAPRWLYATTMGLCILAAIPLVVRKLASRWHTFGLVLLADLIYLIVVFCIEDPVRYASPLMLLFPAFVAAWFLGIWELGVNMVVTTVVCLIALWPSYDCEHSAVAAAMA